MIQKIVENSIDINLNYSLQLQKILRVIINKIFLNSLKLSSSFLGHFLQFVLQISAGLEAPKIGLNFGGGFGGLGDFLPG